jgi:hypothetical protein
MTNDLYRSSYRHLEIPPGSSWLEVRRAYKRLVKKWHPDHFHNDAKTQSIAAEKIKEINCAFDLLSQHYRTHGALPLSGEPSVAEPGGTGSREAWRAAQQTARPVDHATTETDEHKQQPPVDEKKRSGTVTRLVLAALMGWFVYALWLAPELPPASYAPEPGATADNTSPVIDTADSSQPEAAQPRSYFTYGSTIGDVYAVQGIPTKTTDNVWHYGKSKVYFTGGKVTHWEDDPTSPLKASADVSVSASHSVDSAFGIGSTKAQVRAIQGQPLREWANVWEYGMSKVYFDRDRVSGWYDSALNPLQVRK